MKDFGETVKFSELAVFKLEKAIDFLLQEWSEKSKNKFLDKLHARIEAIQANPESYPESKFKPGLRKCVVTKQTSLLYEVHGSTVFIVNIIDTRQDPDKITEEIKKHFKKYY